MPTQTQSWIKKSVDQPDETREFPEGTGELKVLELGDETFGYGVWQPGWRWSTHMKPKVGGDCCEVTHNLFCISGRMHVQMKDGEEFEIGPGDACFVGPGHDAWIVGDEPCVAIDTTGARAYAKS